MYDYEYAEQFELVLNSHNYSDGGMNYFANHYYAELCNQGMQNEADTILADADSDKMTAAWETIIENFTLDDCRLEYDSHEHLYLVPCMINTD